MQISELWKSRGGGIGKNAHETYSCIITGEESDGQNAFVAAYALQFAVPSFPPITTLGNCLDTFDFDPIADGKPIWQINGQYKSREAARQTNDASFSFNTGGGNQRITHSRKTVNSYKAHGAGPAPATMQAIGVNFADHSVDGIEIHKRTFDFKTTFYAPASAMTTDYIDLLYSLTGTVNSDAVQVSVDDIDEEFDAGELLMVGAEGQKRIGKRDWELTVNWSAQPNQTNVTIGTITGITVNGWDYLWVYCQPVADTNANILVPQPSWVYVEQVYAYNPLTPILLPTQFGQGNTQGWTAPASTSGGSFGTNG
ncbi:MAG TPA: hypothetical protein VHY37_03525 [Tepidisphaeraceae bacterium]|jgi:hypothetical protein|nr:hypothetical protein [Tepidisphaeraceae bacterium]